MNISISAMLGGEMGQKNIIASERARNRLSQMEFAEKLNEPYSKIRNLEANPDRMKLRDAIKVADYFNISIDYLAGRTEERTIK